MADSPYVIPGDFSLTAYRGKVWRMIRGGRTYPIVIDFDADVAETVWWILGYGPHARVREPKGLADRVAALVEATTLRYQEND